MVWKNFYNSFNWGSFSDSLNSLTIELKQYNGTYCYTEETMTKWIEFNTLEDLTYFILRFS
jgi:hypothetical protein